MQISITLDIATLNPSQFKAFTELAQSFREVYYIPESVVEPIAPTGSDITPPKKRRKKEIEPAALVEDTSAYADLVQDVTAAITAGNLPTEFLKAALISYGVSGMPDLAQKLHLVPAVRVSLGL